MLLINQGLERQNKEDNNKQNKVSKHLLINYIIVVLTPLDLHQCGLELDILHRRSFASPLN